MINSTGNYSKMYMSDEYDMLDYDISDTFDSDTIITFVPAVIVYSLTFFLGFIGIDRKNLNLKIVNLLILKN
jgi:hypothetical protein